ncbi:polycomb group protein EMBRYONIC FLOWER 2-like isoform X2 [Humulus lupulus]|uniref:polycomb group protein EMBRYONIC FLOWER 2-like isoform X2 n=1 Tax=Humulus lupulus TaxID=3486 RepID=UPI002B414DF3|nr:polycomb group protein EMBRYONIC FLOWER 2-like isoform X2 [Humulus lupulus]
MCRQSCCVHLSVEEAVAVEETLLVYCKPVELYNILRCRALDNPSFLRRCLNYKIQARRKRRLRAGTVIFNYRDCNNMLRKTEVTEDFTCPFCLMQCASFKGLRYHLSSSHDLFNFEYWVTEEYQAVNVSVNVDVLSETIADRAVPQLQTFFFCSRPRRCRRRNLVQNEKNVNVKFLELDSPRPASENIQRGALEKDDDSQSCKDENISKPFPGEKDLPNGRHGREHYGPDFPSSRGEPPLPSKTKKITVERTDSKSRVLLHKRQFYHSHRVQPMALEQVLSDRDSEDEVDDDIADLEDRRMLDDFVDVTKDEKQLMHLWNSFVRKQRVLADGHIPWACEAFSKLHGEELISSKPLFWCWRIFMIKLWNHGLLDACTMNSCNKILEGCRDKAPVVMRN